MNSCGQDLLDLKCQGSSYFYDTQERAAHVDRFSPLL